MDGNKTRSIDPLWWTAILIVVIASMVTLTSALYSGWFKTTVPVTITSDRSGLIMDVGAKVMMNGVQIGTVSGVANAADNVALHLDLDADQVRYVPANVGVKIEATTAFGSKYVAFTYPGKPSATVLTAGAVLQSSNVTTEINSVFDNLVGVLDQVDPAKLNSVLGAFSEAFRGKGDRIGESIADANQVLGEINPRSETIRRDWQSLRDASDTYDRAADNIISTLDAASTTSATITSHATNLDALLKSTAGFAQQGIDVLVPNERNFIDAINGLEPTTSLLLKYNPVLTCTLIGAKKYLDEGGYKSVGGNGRTFIADAAILLGNDKYNYPDNLPVVAAKGGPGGKPSCGSLPDVAKMFPVRALVTNTGWGTGIDYRPNPGVAAQACYANFLPVTRAVPEPPSLRDCLPGPAIGPVTAPGMPPYGAALYGPGGEPLWPGLPPAGTPPPVTVPGTPVAPRGMTDPPGVIGAPPWPVPAPPAAPSDESPAPDSAQPPAPVAPSP